MPQKHSSSPSKSNPSKTPQKNQGNSPLGAKSREESPLKPKTPLQGLIPDELMENFQNSFQTDFAGLRVFPSSPLAGKLGIEAMTQGNEMHFAPGHFDPSQAKGRQLIGHEVAHVVQQRQGRVRPQLSVGQDVLLNQSSELEQEADIWGAMAMQGMPVFAAPPALPNSNGNVAQFKDKVEPEVRQRIADEENRSSVITLHIDADGDQHNKEIFLKFVQTGTNVTLFAGPSSQGEAGLEELFSFKVSLPGGFDISNQHPGGGLRYYKIWFGSEDLELLCKPSKDDVTGKRSQKDSVYYWFRMESRTKDEKIGEKTLKIPKASLETADVVSLYENDTELIIGQKEGDQKGHSKKTVFFRGNTFGDIFSFKFQENIDDPSKALLVLKAHYGKDHKRFVHWPDVKMDVPIPANDKTNNWFYGMQFRVVDEGSFLAIYYSRPGSEAESPEFYSEPGLRIFLNIQGHKIDVPNAADDDYSEKAGYHDALESRRNFIMVQVPDSDIQPAEVKNTHPDLYGKSFHWGSNARGAGQDQSLEYFDINEFIISTRQALQIAAARHADNNLEKQATFEAFSMETRKEVLSMQLTLKKAYDSDVIAEDLYRDYQEFYLEYYSSEQQIKLGHKLYAEWYHNWVESNAKGPEMKEQWAAYFHVWFEELGMLHNKARNLLRHLADSELFPDHKAKHRLYKNWYETGDLFPHLISYHEYNRLAMIMTRDLLYSVNEGYKKRIQELNEDGQFEKISHKILTEEAQEVEYQIETFQTLYEEFFDQFNDESANTENNAFKKKQTILEYVDVKAIFYPEAQNTKRKNLTAVPLKIACFKSRVEETGEYRWYIANLTNGHWHDYVVTTENSTVTKEVFQLLDDRHNLPKGLVVYQTPEFSSAVEMTTPGEAEDIWRSASAWTTVVGLAAMFIFPPAAPFIFGAAGLMNARGAWLKWEEHDREGHLTTSERNVSIAEIASALVSAPLPFFTFASTAARTGGTMARTIMVIKGASLGADATLTYLVTKDFWDRYWEMKKKGIEFDEFSFISFALANGLLGIYGCYSHAVDISSSIKNKAVFDHMAGQLYGTKNMKAVHGTTKGKATTGARDFDGFAGSKLSQEQRKAITENFSYEEIFMYLKKGDMGGHFQKSKTGTPTSQLETEAMLADLGDALEKLKSVKQMDELRMIYAHIHPADMAFLIAKHKGNWRSLHDALENFQGPKIRKAMKQTLFGVKVKSDKKIQKLKDQIQDKKQFREAWEQSLDDIKGNYSEQASLAWKQRNSKIKELEQFEYDFFMKEANKMVIGKPGSKVSLQKSIQKATHETRASLIFKVNQVQKKLDDAYAELIKGVTDPGLKRSIETEYILMRRTFFDIKKADNPFFFRKGFGFDQYQARVNDPRLESNLFGKQFADEMEDLSQIAETGYKKTIDFKKQIKAEAQRLRDDVMSQKGMPKSKFARDFWGKKTHKEVEIKDLEIETRELRFKADNLNISDKQVQMSRSYLEARKLQKGLKKGKYKPEIDPSLKISYGEQMFPGFHWEIMREFFSGTLGLVYRSPRFIGINNTPGLFKGLRRIMNFTRSFFDPANPRILNEEKYRETLLKLHDGLFLGEMDESELYLLLLETIVNDPDFQVGMASEDFEEIREGIQEFRAGSSEK